jgi:hypothetical protein
MNNLQEYLESLPPDLTMEDIDNRISELNNQPIDEYVKRELFDLHSLRFDRKMKQMKGFTI